MPISKLASRRQLLGLTQQDLSKLSGVDQALISRVERGDTKFQRMSVANAVALARVLRVTVEELYEAYKEEQK